jgi:hypothetical protein
MYRIESLFGNRWAVVGDDGKTACVGTMGQCEDWLDFQENYAAARGTSTPARWLRSASPRILLPSFVAWATSVALGLYMLFACQTTAGGAGKRVADGGDSQGIAQDSEASSH